MGPIRDLFRWNPTRRRSTTQKTNIQKALDTKNSRLEEYDEELDADKENDDEAMQELERLGARAERYKKNFQNERKKVGRVVRKLQAVHQKLRDMTAAQDTTEDLCQKAQLQLDKSESEVARLQHDKEALMKRNGSLRVRVSRSSRQKEKAITRAVEKEQKKKSAFHVQEKGVVTEASRAMMRDLVALGVKATTVNAAVGCVAGHLGTTVEGKFTSRSTRRAVIEGGIASNLQIAEEMKSGGGITISSDGTTHKNINYESRFMTITNENAAPKTRFLGISAATHHTSEEQLDGWIKVIQLILDVFNSSPRAQELGKMEIREFFKLLKGMHTDHAEDQKKLVRLIEALKQAYERESRGETELLSMEMVQLLPLLLEVGRRTVERASGPDIWISLSKEDQEARNQEGYRELCREYGCRKFETLSDEEKRSVDLFLWAGCCMHKELNSVKGGNTRMMAWWTENKVVGPIKLMNRDNAAAASAGGTVGTRAAEVSQGGAVKLTSLAGALFNHKDDKKGQHDTYRFYMEAAFGYIISFPDTSNTRYQTHCLAAVEIMVHLEIYIQFLLLIKDKKDSRTLNHLEQNVLTGLRDTPTIHELCVLVVYSQAISVPYLRFVRGNTRTNVLDLAPLHKKVAEHCQKVIVNPDILIGSDATHTTGSLDGSMWERADAMYTVLRLAPALPHLRDLVRTFFEGALETWLRFSAEFAEGGAIDNASASERSQAWMETTNDLNEGALGAWRKAARDDGNMSLLYYNGKTMYKRNDTAQYIETLAPETHQYIRSKTRALDSSQLEQGRRHKQIGYDRALVEKKHKIDAFKQQKRDDKEELLKNLVIRLDPTQINEKNITVDEINNQLDWHRKWGPNGSKIPVKTKCGVKAERLELLRAAIIQFNESGRKVDECASTFDDSMVVDNNGDIRDGDIDTAMQSGA